MIHWLFLEAAVFWDHFQEFFKYPECSTFKGESKRALSLGEGERELVLTERELVLQDEKVPTWCTTMCLPLPICNLKKLKLDQHHGSELTIYTRFPSSHKEEKTESLELLTFLEYACTHICTCINKHINAWISKYDWIRKLSSMFQYVS